ncbi:MAG: hypothetical protein M3341_11155, partial [Actinomycetota bacterium]|nr:hypothetical protein [Actinomycetota bacterium]
MRTRGRETGERRNAGAGAAGRPIGGTGHRRPLLERQHNTTTVENFKGPKGLLAPLLNLDILPSPESDTTTLESGGSGDHQG